MERAHDNALYKVFEANKKRKNSSSSSTRVGSGSGRLSEPAYTNWSEQNRIPTAWESISPKARLNIERVAKEAARTKNRRNTKQERRLSISSPTVSSEESTVSSHSNSTTIMYRHQSSSSATPNLPSINDPEIYKYLDEAIQKHANRLQMEQHKKRTQRNKSKRKTERNRYCSETPSKKRDVPPNKRDTVEGIDDVHTGNIFLESLVKFCAQLQDSNAYEGKKKVAKAEILKKKDSPLHRKGCTDSHSYEEGSSCNRSKSRRSRGSHSPKRPDRKDGIIDDIARLLKKLYIKSLDKLFDNKNIPSYDRHYTVNTVKEASHKKMLAKNDEVFQDWEKPFSPINKVCTDKCVETDYGIAVNRNISPITRENVSGYCNEAGDGYRKSTRFLNSVPCDAEQEYFTDNAFNKFKNEECRTNGYLIDNQGKEQQECIAKMAKLWEDMLAKFKDVTRAVGDSDKYMQEAVEQQRTEMTETVHLWRECMRRYDLLNRDIDDKDCAFQEQAKNQKEEMHEQTKMWQDCLSKYREINENLTKLSHKISTHRTNPTIKTPQNRNPLPEPPPRPPPPMLPTFPPQYPSYAPTMAFPPFYARPIMRPPPVPIWKQHFFQSPYGQGKNCTPGPRRFQDPRHCEHCPSGCRCQGSIERFWDREIPPVFGRCQDLRHGQNYTHCIGHRVEETNGRFRNRRTSPRFKTGRGERLGEGGVKRDFTPTGSSGSNSSGKEREVRRVGIGRNKGSRSDAGHKEFEGD